MSTSRERGGPVRATLSRDLIVAAAVEILDNEGEGALTFRALAAHLATGSGAIYWHLADKTDLLTAATETVVAKAIIDVVDDVTPQDTIRVIAGGVFDAIDTHPWVGSHLAREPWQSAIVRILDGVGVQLQSMGVPEEAQFNAASALVGYILGLAAQYAAAVRIRSSHADRSTFLRGVAAQWTQLDPERYAFVHRVAEQLPDHDDREQFLAGIDLFLAGVGARR